MDFNAQNQTPNPNMPMNAGGEKAGPLALIIIAIVVAGLVVGTYLYMQGWVKDYYPGFMVDYGIGGKMMGDRTSATDAGPEIMLNKDTTNDIQGDLDQTMVEDVDKQFMEVDKDLQSL